MPLFCEAPQPDSAALRARFFGAGRKFTEDLVGVAQTTQLADAGRAVEGGGVTTRWVLMCKFQLPICTGGRPEAAGATSRQLGTRTLLFAPRGASACLRRKERASELAIAGAERRARAPRGVHVQQSLPLVQGQLFFPHSRTFT